MSTFLHRSTRRLALWALCATLGIGIFVSALSEPQAQTQPVEPNFTKSAYDEQGNPLTGPVTDGQVIQYVLRYKPDGSTSAVNISDVLSASQTFVPGSIQAPPGWSWTSPDYGSNTETYLHPGLSPHPGFTMNIPDGGGSMPSAGGDGTRPIVIGTNVYAIFHHKQFKSSLPSYGNDTPGALIMCWNAATLQTCAGTWPLSLDLPGDERTTTTATREFVVDKLIYYASARRVVTTVGTTTTTDTVPGMGCWNTATETPCAFVPMPVTMSPSGVYDGYGSPTPYHLLTRMAGIVGVVSSTNPGTARAYMNVDDAVYCYEVPAGTPCPSPWVSPTGIAVSTSSTPYHANALMLEVSPTPTKLFVYAGSHPAQVVCIDLATGATCWTGTAPANNPTTAFNLSPMVASNGTVTTGVCLHPQPTNVNMACFDANTGAALPVLPLVVDTNNTTNYYTRGLVIYPFVIPGTNRVLYPNYVYAPPVCRNFSGSSPVICSTTDWNPNWWTGFPGIGGGGSVTQLAAPQQDYAYAVDPINPTKCLLGLGNAGILWRFEQNGTYPTTECLPKEYRETFQLESLFCGTMPTTATWDTIEITNRPGELDTGTIEIYDSQNNQIGQTINVVQGTNTYAINAQATGAASTITVIFKPVYSDVPSQVYQLHINVTANEDQQICYRAEVTSCEGVSNTATMDDNRGVVTATVDLGKPIGGDCGPVVNANCLQLEPTIQTNADGTVTLSIAGGLNPFALGNSDITFDTSGIVAVPASQSFTDGHVEWTLTGVTPGQAVTFNISGTASNAGSIEGTDLCCESNFTVIIPKEPEEPEGENPDIAIEKTFKAGDTARVFSFFLRAWNSGQTSVPGNAIVVTDTVPPNMMFNQVVGTDWDCGAASQGPSGPGTVVTCVYIGSQILAPGDSLPPIWVDVRLPQDGDYVNCAQVAPSTASGLVETRLDNNESCYSSTEETDTGGDIDIAIEKHSQPGQPPGKYEFRLMTWNTTSVAFPGNILVVTDTVPPGLTFDAVSATGWDCGPATQFPMQAGSTLTCTYTSSAMIAVGDSVTPIIVSASSSGPVAPGEFDNCATVSPSSASGLVDPQLFNNEGCWGTTRHTYTPACDEETTTSPAGYCKCLYPTMVPTSATSCECPDGTALVPGVGCQPTTQTPIPDPEDTDLDCDRDTTVADGNRCKCRFPRMTRVDASECKCARGTHLVKGRGCERDEPVKPTLEQCEQRSTVPTADGCACRWPGMTRVNGTSCACPRGTELVPGKGCQRPAGEPLVCDADSAKLRRGECVCRYPGMTKASETSCTCPAGRRLVPGQGCEKIPSTTSTPVPGPAATPEAVSCPANQTLDPKLGCVPKCVKPMVLDRKTRECACPDGMEMKEGKCVKEEGGFLDDVLDNVDVNIGVGVGGGDGPKPTKPTDVPGP